MGFCASRRQHVGIEIPMSVSRHYATVILSRMPKPWLKTHGYPWDRRYATQNLPGRVNQPGRFNNIHQFRNALDVLCFLCDLLFQSTVIFTEGKEGNEGFGAACHADVGACGGNALFSLLPSEKSIAVVDASCAFSLFFAPCAHAFEMCILVRALPLTDV